MPRSLLKSPRLLVAPLGLLIALPVHVCCAFGPMRASACAEPAPAVSSGSCCGDSSAPVHAPASPASPRDAACCAPAPEAVLVSAEACCVSHAPQAVLPASGEVSFDDLVPATFAAPAPLAGFGRAQPPPCRGPPSA